MPIMTKEKFDEMFESINPAQSPSELWWMMEKLNQIQPERVLEIGGGGSTLFWSFFAPTISLTLGNYATAKSGVPHESEPFGGFEEIFIYNGSPFYTGARTFVCDSHLQSTLENVAALGPYDFLFIDGDHRRTGVQMDIEMYFPLVRPGGLAAFHDWSHQGTYVPDGNCHPVQLAFKNLGMVPTEVNSDGKLGYGIATYQL